MKGAGGVPVVAAPGGRSLVILKLDISLVLLDSSGLFVDKNLLLFNNLNIISLHPPFISLSRSQKTNLGEKILFSQEIFLDCLNICVQLSEEGGGHHPPVVLHWRGEHD